MRPAPTLRAAALLIFLLAPALIAQQSKPEGAQMKVLPQAELEVVKVLLAQERAWNKGDMSAYISGYKNAPDTLFISRDVEKGYDGLLERYKKNYPDHATMGTLNFSDLEPRLLDERYAILTGRYHLERDKKSGGNANGIFSLLLEKTDAGWKIILDHTT